MGFFLQTGQNWQNWHQRLSYHSKISYLFCSLVPTWNKTAHLLTAKTQLIVMSSKSKMFSKWQPPLRIFGKSWIVMVFRVDLWLSLEMNGLCNYSKKLILRVLWLIFLLLIDSNWLFNVGCLLCLLLWKLSCCFLLSQFWFFILVVVVVQGRCQYKPQLTSIETTIYALCEYVSSAQRKFPYLRIMVNGVHYQ